MVGCAGSFPSPTSPASCYLVQAEDADGRTWAVALDLGNGSLGPLQERVDLAGLDAVLLTHLHPDHFLDLCGLYVALRYDPRGRRRESVLVHGPAGTLARVLDAYGGEDRSAIKELFDVREWQDGRPVTVGPLRITPIRVNHPVEAYGLRVEHGHRTAVLAYTGDTDDCPALDVLGRDADILLSEASFQEGRESIRDIHLTGLRAGQAARRAGARRLMLTHIPTWTDPEVVAAEARSAFTGEVLLARAGITHEV